MNIELTDKVAKKFMNDLGMPSPKCKIKRITFMFESGQASINVDDDERGSEHDQINIICCGRNK